MPLCDPGLWNLDIAAGATFVKRATPSGTPWDLTGYTARAMIRPDYVTAPTLSMTNGTAGTAYIALGGTAGYVEINIDAATTAAMGSAAAYAPASYVWDIELVSGTDVTRFAYGLVSLSPESTR